MKLSCRRENFLICSSSSMVECLPSKQEVFASSSLVYCSMQGCSIVEKQRSPKPRSKVQFLSSLPSHWLIRGNYFVKSNCISKRNLKTQLLCDELQHWGLISQETDVEAIKVMANVIPERMLMRIINKLQRKRMNRREAS